MGGKSYVEMTFNVYHEIEEIQDPMYHYTKELSAPWGYSDSVNLRGSVQRDRENR